MKKIIIFLLAIFVGMFIGIKVVAADANSGPHWVKNPIIVYVPQNKYADMMKRAFQKWSVKSNGLVSFDFVQVPPADIEVEFVEEADGSDGDIGSYSTTVKGGYIVNATISIAPNPSKNSNNLIYTTMLHEIGHVLGLKDTNRTISIMGSPVTDKLDITNMDIIRLYKLGDYRYIHHGSKNPKF